MHGSNSYSICCGRCCIHYRSTPEGLSLWVMFWEAAPIIKLVIIVLLGASFWCWTIIFQKLIRLRRLHTSAEQFEEAFWSGALDALYDRINNRPQDPLSAIFCAAMREWRRSISRPCEFKRFTRYATTTY